MTRREKIDAFIATLKNINTTHVFNDPKQLLDLTPEMCPEWTVGMVIPSKAVVQYKGIKYYCATGATAQAHFPPDGQGLEAVYKPYTDKELKNWIYNEYVESGWQRIDPNGNTYEVYNVGGGALMNNLWQPSALPANWKLLT